MSAFENLSPEGKLQKIRQHLDGSGHPVPAPWVEWLLANGQDGKPAVDRDEIESRVDGIVAAVANLVDRICDVRAGVVVYYEDDSKARKDLAEALLAGIGLKARDKGDDD